MNFQTKILLIKLINKDRISFLQGQTCNDISSLQENSWQYSAILNHKSHILYTFIVLKTKDEIYLLLEDKDEVFALQEHLEKYLISEEVTLSLEERYLNHKLGVIDLPLYSFRKENESFIISSNCLNVASYFILNSCQEESLLLEEDYEALRYSSFWQRKNNFKGILFNETILPLYCLSLNKGCFLGQEVVARLSHKGSVNFNVLMMFAKEEFSLKDYIIENFKITVLTKVYSKELSQFIYWVRCKKSILDLQEQLYLEQHKISLYSFDNNFHQIKSKELYDKALKICNQKSNEFDKEAIFLLEEALKYNYFNVNALESLAVMQGRYQLYEKAIETLRQLINIDNKIIMAHSNLSLYYMKIGKIKQAEDAKAQATILSFKEKGNKPTKAKLTDKIAMFENVLKLDAKDPLANYGMAFNLFNMKEYTKANSYFITAIKYKKDYSQAYLTYAKNLLMQKNYSLALENLNQALFYAEKKKELNVIPEIKTLQSKIKQA